MCVFLCIVLDMGALHNYEPAQKKADKRSPSFAWLASLEYAKDASELFKCPGDEWPGRYGVGWKARFHQPHLHVRLTPLFIYLFWDTYRCILPLQPLANNFAI